MMLATIQCGNFCFLICCEKPKIRIYETIIFPVFLNACETWSLTVREKQRHRVFENRVLKRLFGPKRAEVIRGYRKLHDELQNLFSSPRIIRMIKSRRMGWARYVARMGRRGMRVGYWWDSQKRPPGRPRCRWVDNIKMNLR
jgi:hypothetical protein